MSLLTRSTILSKLKDIQPAFEKEGFLIKALFGSYSRNDANENSDIDILVEATPQFATKYGFQAINRIKEIQLEISNIFGVPVDLADSTGMGITGRKFILDRAIYV
jgi:predicted nucleotidyltransferase